MSEPDRIGKYRVIRPLAMGGMGEVFLARQEGPAGFARNVAVKRLLRHLSSDTAFVELFLNEARLAALLSHPNIVQIIELGQDGPDYFMAMEYVQGATLGKVMQQLAQRSERMAPELAACVAVQALQGLHCAHSFRDDAGRATPIVHRDVSPDNILVSFSGTVKVADFGVAKALDAASTPHTRVRGKYGYMAPEQLSDGTVSPRSDLYALGVVLYELLAGGRPHTAPAEGALVRAIMEEPPESLAARAPHTPPALAAVVMKALARVPGERFASAQAMAQELEKHFSKSHSTSLQGALGQFVERLVGGGSEARASAPAGTAADGSQAPTVDAAPAAHRGGSKRRVVALGIAGALLSAGAAGAWALLRRPPTQSSPDTEEITVSAGEPTPIEEEAPAPPESHPDASQTQPASPARARKPLSAPGRIEVRVNPWAEVSMDGRRIGVTPLPAFEAAPGNHLCVLKNASLGIERKFRVRVASGKTTSLTADLAAK